MKEYDSAIFDAIYNRNENMASIAERLNLTRSRVGKIANRAFNERGLLQDGETVQQYYHKRRLNALYTAIDAYWKETGLPPTQTILSNLTGIHQTQISKLLRELKQQGKITGGAGQIKAVRIVS